MLLVTLKTEQSISIKWLHISKYPLVCFSMSMGFYRPHQLQHSLYRQNTWKTHQNMKLLVLCSMYAPDTVFLDHRTQYWCWMCAIKGAAYFPWESVNGPRRDKVQWVIRASVLWVPSGSLTLLLLLLKMYWLEWRFTQKCCRGTLHS